MNAVAAGDADSERSAVLARPRLVPSGTPAFRADDVRVTFGSVVALGRRSRSV